MKAVKKINKQKLSEWINSLIQQGKIVIAPKLKGNKVFFGQIKSFSEIAQDYVQTEVSAKSSVFPRYEKLFTYSKTKDDITINNTELEVKETVVFGIRPCDAAGFAYLHDFFTNQNPDYHYGKRKEKLTLITVSCNKSNEFCFCTSVGLGPGQTHGSDIQLTHTKNDEIYVEVLTGKGLQNINENSTFFDDSQEVDKTPFLAEVPIRIDRDLVLTKIQSLFNSQKWNEEALGCLGCGACAFACPTCTCFDIQDEGGMKEGVRVRCWDSCGFGLFTKHASGHNPRHNQTERRRQRLMHKFNYSVTNLNTVSCTGCGRCIKVCPSQVNIVENLKAIVEA